MPPVKVIAEVIADVVECNSPCAPEVDDIFLNRLALDITSVPATLIAIIHYPYNLYIHDDQTPAPINVALSVWVLEERTALVVASRIETVPVIFLSQSA
jgi:hypothetical protein